MESTRNLCAQIPIALHQMVREQQEASGKTLSEYITDLLTEYFKGGHMTMTTRTVGFQIPEELFQRLKVHLEQKSEQMGRKITQREFVITLIKQALDNEQQV